MVRICLQPFGIDPTVRADCHRDSVDVKKAGKPDTGKPFVRFDEGALMTERLSGHVVAACGEASS